MIDGPSEITDLAKTAANKEIVRGFVTEVLLGGKLDRVPAYVDGDRYVQHNPLIGDGVSALGAALKALAEQGKAIEYDRVHMVLGEGNFVIVRERGHVRRRAYGVLRPVPRRERQDRRALGRHRCDPARAEWKNDNGKF